MAATLTATGRRSHQVTLKSAGTPAADGDGGSTIPMTTLASGIWASILTAAAQDMERITAGTVLAQASVIVTIPYIAGVTPRTQVLYGSRTLDVLSVTNVEEANRELVLLCAEVVT